MKKILTISFFVSSVLSCNAALATDMATLPKSSKSRNTHNVDKSDPIKVNKTYSEQESDEYSENTFYALSNKHVNRIITPFRSPVIVIDSIPNLSYKQRGNILYLALPSTLNEVVAGWITEKGDESSVIRVLFKPMPIKPQQVELQKSSTPGTAVARKFERANPRNDAVREVIYALALGNLPLGYQMMNVNGSYIPNCKQAGLNFDFYRGQFASGGDYVVSIGTVENTSNHIIQLAENNCYTDGVVGVAAYPETELLPFERSEVYVMFYRNKNIQSSPQTPRKSLLD